MKKVKSVNIPEGLLKNYFGDDRIADFRSNEHRSIVSPLNTEKPKRNDCVGCERTDKRR